MRIRWRGLELPSRVTTDRSTLSSTYGIFVAEPFERSTAERFALLRDGLACARDVAGDMSDAASEVSGQVVGVAGARFFAYQVSETEGYLGDGDQPLTEAELVAHWDAATR